MNSVEERKRAARVLVAEDDGSMRDFLAYSLRQAGYEVLRVYTLAEPLWSLRGTLYTLGLLRGLVWRPNHDRASFNGGPPAGTSDVSDYRPPTGIKRVATETSRLLMKPIVGAMTRAGLAERLVAEAKPR